MADPKMFSPAEVALHSTKKDCWISIHGKVYDVTTFLEDHPGGEDVVLHASAMGDVTRPFEDVGHSTTAKSMMDRYEIGILEGYVGSKEFKARTAKKEGSHLQLPRVQEKSYGVVDYLMPSVILVVAFGAWYYLTYVNVA